MTLAVAPVPRVLVTFTGSTETGISADVRRFTVTRGRSRERETMSPGRAEIDLWNFAGKYDPDNAAGPYYPNMPAEQDGPDPRVHGLGDLGVLDRLVRDRRRPCDRRRRPLRAPDLHRPARGRDADLRRGRPPTDGRLAGDRRLEAAEPRPLDDGVRDGRRPDRRAGDRGPRRRDPDLAGDRARDRAGDEDRPVRGRGPGSVRLPPPGRGVGAGGVLHRRERLRDLPRRRLGTDPGDAGARVRAGRVRLLLDRGSPTTRPRSTTR